MKHTFLLCSLITAQAQAQIIYTDVVPDQTFPAIGDTCSLDVDNDGNVDFLIAHHTWTVPCSTPCVGTRQRNWVKITPMGTNAVANTVPYASQLPPSQSIDPALTWDDAGGQVLLIRGTPGCINWGLSHICSPGGITGQWLNGASVASPQFLGLRFDSAGSTFYGWASLSIPSNGATFTLKDYAYNSVPDEFILAGEGADITTSVARIANPSVHVSPNPFTSTVSISIGAAKPGVVTCTVRSLTGQPLVTRSMAGSVGRSTFNLDLASLAQGVYLLDVTIAGERSVRKVMKE